jgi:hypothetical protein
MSTIRFKYDWVGLLGYYFTYEVATYKVWDSEKSTLTLFYLCLGDPRI